MKRNNWILCAGVINFAIGLLHLVGGQIDLVTPLLSSSLTDQQKAEWLGVWHMVTILLLMTSFFLIRFGWKPRADRIKRISFIGWFYVFAGISFLIVSAQFQLLAPQWILLIPTGILALIGVKRAL